MTHQDQHDQGQHEQAIEDVLHALQTTEPPQGYEARIHNALLQAQQASMRSTTFNVRHPERSAAKSKNLLASLLPTMSWAAACASLLVIGIAVHSYVHHDASGKNSAIAMKEITSPAGRQQHSKLMLVLEADTATTKPRTRHILREQQLKADTQPRRIEVELQIHENIPEPPLPLTEQERLVLRMARTNTAQQLAEYTPDARARQLREDAQAYKDYFAEKPLDGQPIYHQQISGGNQ